MRQEQASWGRVAGGLRNPCARLGEAGGGCLRAIFSPRNLTGPLGCCCGGGRCGAVSLHTLHDAPHTLHTLSTHSPVQTRSAHILRPRNSPPTHSNSGRCTQEMLRSTTNKHNCRRVSASNKCTVHITAARVNVCKGNIHNYFCSPENCVLLQRPIFYTCPSSKIIVCTAKKVVFKPF